MNNSHGGASQSGWYAKPTREDSEVRDSEEHPVTKTPGGGKKGLASKTEEAAASTDMKSSSGSGLNSKVAEPLTSVSLSMKWPCNACVMKIKLDTL